VLVVNMRKRVKERSHSGRLQLRRPLVDDAQDAAADRILEAGFWSPPFTRAGTVIAFAARQLATAPTPTLAPVHNTPDQTHVHH
jgi:hypothetical protein